MNVVTETAAAHTDEVRDAQAALQDVTSGTCDLVWINGANFRRMREEDTLFGPFAEALPSADYYDFTSDAIAYDFGYPTDGYEMPYNTAQVVFIYNRAHIPEPAQPPMTIPDLQAWIQSNPGKFKYSAPPTHFTGSMIVRHFFCKSSAAAGCLTSLTGATPLYRLVRRGGPGQRRFLDRLQRRVRRGALSRSLTGRVAGSERHRAFPARVRRIGRQSVRGLLPGGSF